MRISDWSSDVCSSDLTFSIRKNLGRRPSTKRRKSQSSVPRGSCVLCRLPAVLNDWHGGPPIRTSTSPSLIPEIGRASGRERVCQYVYNSVVDVSLKQKKHTNKSNTQKVR